MDWREIAFADNQPCINLISLKPYGILRILDDQCCFPQVNRRCSCAWHPRPVDRDGGLKPPFCAQAWGGKCGVRTSPTAVVRNLSNPETL